MNTPALLLVIAPLLGAPGPPATPAPAHLVHGVVFDDANRTVGAMRASPESPVSPSPISTASPSPPPMAATS